ncbi:hypothetical protein FNV43_RR24464 [Rhamnella rubrinervis]|uniref:Glutaredoxin domain-containing protein n=1 Tax=Rhamnella rubrinervis TaxID=2594499 RepID=A0A8K0GL85_9ROSA|nr:hypothetical protein FNV43_RR24464 [Rhamnella rubrinervis]
MWSPWLSSPSRGHRSKSQSSTFSCSSFKDIQNLCKEEPEPEPEPGILSPRTASIFHRVRILRLWTHSNSTATSIPTLPDGDQRVVIYYTSLRVVRKTFEACRVVRSILKGFRVPMDERDVSMDAQSLDELQGIIGCKNLSLPLVFIGGRYIGGAEEIKQLHERGELRRLIQGLPVVDPRGCDLCGGLRFVVCDICDGSHKVYMEKCGFRTCMACNENGLTKCPTCCSLRLRHSRA